MANHGQTQQIKQMTRLAMNTTLETSLKILQADNWTLHAYLNEIVAANPLLDVHPAKSYQSNASTDAHLAWLANLPEKKPSLEAHLAAQIRLMAGTAADQQHLLQLITFLDDQGYLRMSPSACAQVLNVSERQAQQLLTQFRELDPPGIGAESLQASLIKQAAVLGFDRPSMALLRLPQTLLETEHWSAIASRLDLSLDQLTRIRQKLRQLTPNPAAAYTTSAEVVAPICVALEANIIGDAVLITLADQNFPQMRFDQVYREVLQKQSADPDLAGYLQKAQQLHQQLTKSLAKRAQTLLQIGQWLARVQSAFFLRPDHPLKAMTQREAAAELGLSPSTMTRAIQGKWLQTADGPVPLKHFFSHHEAANPVSGQTVQQYLAYLVATESAQHPLNDQQLAQQLATNGFAVARRTVAKYRSQLGIAPVSRRKTQRQRLDADDSKMEV